METPVSVYSKVFPQGEACLLESVEGAKKLARYSFLAGEPYMTLKACGNEVETVVGGKSERSDANFFTSLRQALNKYEAAKITGLPKYYGGAVGYIGYDTVRLLEKLPHQPEADLNLPDAYMIFPEVVIIFDHLKSSLKIVINVRPGNIGEELYQKAVKKIERIIDAIRNNGKHNTSGNNQNTADMVSKIPEIESNMSYDHFAQKVVRIKNHIASGDILQAVLSQRFSGQIAIAPFEIYRNLRVLNPSPYMYYLDFADVKIAGASPEMLVRVENGQVETRPIAGTRPRGRDEQEDCKLAEELIKDSKEKAEHLMLVDLGRNDIGKVSEYGSVAVPTFMSCDRYSHVMHLVSEVTGKLKEEYDAIDAFQACFPAGTVTGAPKIRAMEIIDQLEPHKRGPYAGAVGYFAYGGNMDTCLTIRTIIFKDGRAYAQAGAGIVADSQPKNEFEETKSKAQVLIKAINNVGEGRI